MVSTLIGNWLPAWQPKVKVKEVVRPKFYFFDGGVVRSILARTREPLDRLEQEPLLETYIFHELQAYQNKTGCGGKFYYWRTPSGQEVDFIWVRGRHSIGIEVKTSTNWKRGFGTVLRNLHQAKALTGVFAIYMGDTVLKDGPISVLPVVEFLKRLSSGGVIPEVEHRATAL